MGFKCGIVGLPNVGKSTLFNALTNAGIAAANYPFCTIDPNIGNVPVPDPRLETIAKIAQSKEIIPTSVQFVDIAGLVAGAAKGEGLGNKFLAHIREVHAIAHVVRCFDNDDITHVAGKVNPLSDIAIIDTELALADLDSLRKILMKAEKEAKRGDKEAAKIAEALATAGALLNEGMPLRRLMGDETMAAILESYQFLTAKPVLYIANVDEQDSQGAHYLRAVQEHAAAEGADVVALSAALEAEMSQLTAADQHEFLSALGLAEPGLHRVIRAGYHLLNLNTYFTVGPKEARAWTIRQGITAPQAAGVIHTDFEKGFIRAEVMRFEDYVAYKGEQGVKDAGKWRLEGKEYVVVDGDIMLFRFNV